MNRATVVMAQKWVSMRFTLFSAARRSVQRPLTSAVLSATLLLVSSCRAEQPWPLWEKYSARYLDDQGRVIDHTSSDRSTTEGEAYAMFFALVTNDRPRFEKLLNWTESNLAQGDLTLHLPAWSWGQAANKSWGVLDSNSAADADLWMAYSLCEAGRLWHVDRYSKLGTVLAARIAQQEVVSVPSVGTVLLPGSQGFHPSPTTWYVNPSYLPPFLLEYFAHANPQSPWGAVLASLPAAVESRGGFAMDWMAVKADAGLQPSPPPGVAAALKEGETAPTPMGSFDAIRVYLWTGMADPRTPHVGEALRKLPAMAAYLSKNLAPPLQVGPAGQVLNADGTAGFSAAVIPYLHALGDKAEEKTQVDRLGAMLDPNTGMYGHNGMYYDQNLALFEEGWTSGRFSFDAEGRLRLKWK